MYSLGGAYQVFGGRHQSLACFLSSLLPLACSRGGVLAKGAILDVFHPTLRILLCRAQENEHWQIDNCLKRVHVFRPGKRDLSWLTSVLRASSAARIRHCQAETETEHAEGRASGARRRVVHRRFRGGKRQVHAAELQGRATMYGGRPSLLSFCGGQYGGQFHLRDRFVKLFGRRAQSDSRHLFTQFSSRIEAHISGPS